jgi:hypothetical protein
MICEFIFCLALLCFKAGIGFIDDVCPTLAAHHLAIAVAVLQGFN